MRRWEFIAGIGSAAAWPVVARGQQSDRVPRIGVLMAFDENDPVAKSQLSAFTKALADLGWADGRNVRMDLRWGDPDAVSARLASVRLVRHSVPKGGATDRSNRKRRLKARTVEASRAAISYRCSGRTIRSC
jgi:hypothetical protein